MNTLKISNSIVHEYFRTCAEKRVGYFSRSPFSVGFNKCLHLNTSALQADMKAGNHVMLKIHGSIHVNIH